MDTTSAAPLSLPSLLINLGFGILLSLIVAWYYVQFGRSLSNRRRFAPILPLLTLITLLVITIVKSSLALSLGLVGALSIVRFRTAIKDPEELIFLFFAIAIGLGLGADQRVPTLAAVGVIMVYLMARVMLRKSFKQDSSHSLYLNIELESADQPGADFSMINELLLKDVLQIDLRRLDNQNGSMQVTYYISVSDQQTIINLMDHLKQELPGSSISLVEQNNLLGG